MREIIIQEWRDVLGMIHQKEVGKLVRCHKCIHYRGHEEYCECDHFAQENGYCFYGDEGDDK